MFNVVLTNHSDNNFRQTGLEPSPKRYIILYYVIIYIYMMQYFCLRKTCLQFNMKEHYIKTGKYIIFSARNVS